MLSNSLQKIKKPYKLFPMLGIQKWRLMQNEAFWCKMKNDIIRFVMTQLLSIAFQHV